jgi:putative transposase
MQRGHNKLPCFYDADDYEYFQHCLQKSAEQYLCDVHAYVLLKNEFHVILTPLIEGAISQMMQSLGRRYVQYVNHRYHRSGTLWEGRYKSSLIDSSAFLITCSRYLELLPVDLKVVDVATDYLWSSHRKHVLAEENPIVKEHKVYLELGESDEERCEVYRDFLGFELDPGLKKHISETINLEMVLGGDMFKYRIQSMIDRPVRSLKRGRPPKSQ